MTITALAPARLRAAGVAILSGPLVLEGRVTWLYLGDADNNVLEYVQWYDRG